MTKILFVCLGNICRSPAAEGYFSHLLKENDLSNDFVIDSAGTSAYHEGEPADGRMQDVARERGYTLESISRGFNHKTDFQNFDLIITMDHKNYQDVIDLSPNKEAQQKVHAMTDFCHIHNVNHVPDPYYKGVDGFELTMDIIEDACDGLLKKLREGL